MQYAVYLIGDAGLPNYGENDTVKIFLRQQLLSAKNKASIIFMGDNIYPAGMPPEGHKNRAKAENSIASQLEILQGFKGNIFFIPGNHDWNQSHKGGKEYIIREAAYLEKSDQNLVTFLPDSACPGPVEVLLQPDLVLLLIDSEWWLHKHEKPYGENSYCSAKNEEQFGEQLKQMLEKNKNKQVIIAAHHPVFSNGTHGGYFPLKDHIFPLAAFRKNMYLPLPVLGSIYVAYRKYFGHRQDIANYKYSAYNHVVKNALAKYSNIIYAAGHEHNLQYFNQQNNHFIVSGSGSKSYYIKRGGKADYAHNTRGFAIIKLYNDNAVWLEYWGADKATGEMRVYFKNRLK
ncbi:MAG: metallophosphoesterase [Bacteroidia bacterium]